jgi:hypothetical protein
VSRYANSGCAPICPDRPRRSPCTCSIATALAARSQRRAELAAVAGCSERHVRRLIAPLIAAGVVTVEYNAGGTGAYRNDRRPNLYTVDLFATADGRTPMSPRDDGDGEDTHVPP